MGTLEPIPATEQESFGQTKKNLEIWVFHLFFNLEGKNVFKCFSHCLYLMYFKRRTMYLWLSVPCWKGSGSTGFWLHTGWASAPAQRGDHRTPSVMDNRKQICDPANSLEINHPSLQTSKHIWANLESSICSGQMENRKQEKIQQQQQKNKWVISQILNNL